MATTLPPSQPPTPSPSFPAFPRLPSASISVQRTASSASSRSEVSSSSSLEAVPMRAPPVQTRTAATTPTPSISRVGSPEAFERTDSGEGSSRSRGRGGHYGGPGVGMYGSRGLMRNGPRTKAATAPLPPSIITTRSPGSSPEAPERVRTSTSVSPTTPRTLRGVMPDQPRATTPNSAGPLRVMVSMGQADTGSADGSNGSSGPSSPVGPRGRKPGPPSPRSRRASTTGPRQLSVEPHDPRRNSGSAERERRQSQVSASSGAPSRRLGIKDYILGEELGRGSYSTVVQAKEIPWAGMPTDRPPRQYAIKIINQAHLIQEKKAKYAKIERDALIRLATAPPKPTSPPSPVVKAHRAGQQSGGSGGQQAAAKKRSSGSMSSTRRDSIPSTVSSSTVATQTSGREKISLITQGLASDTLANLSPSVKTLPGRRPSRSADPPEAVPEKEEVAPQPTDAYRSRPPSPVYEESALEIPSQPSTRPPSLSLSPTVGSPPELPAPMYATSPSSKVPVTPTMSTFAAEQRANRGSKSETPRKRRTSTAPSERSIKSQSSRSPVAHPGIIRLFSTFNDQASLYFVLELASNGELLSYIRKYGSFDLTSARYYAAQLIDTIEFMHERGVVHRDLKPENILLDADMRIKVTDFGSAKLLSREEMDSVAFGRKSEDKADAKEPQSKGKGSFVGSAFFVSPEVLDRNAGVPASDVWAFGCIFFQLVYGKPPFRGNSDYLTFRKILQREIEWPEGMDEEVKSLIDWILTVDPYVRPTATEIKAHPFFASVNWSTIFSSPAPPISTGMTQPIVTLASIDPQSAVWAVFDDEVSDGGFDLDDADEPPVRDARDHRTSPNFDGLAARSAVQSMAPGVAPSQAGLRVRDGSNGSLEPPRLAWVQAQEQGAARNKSRGFSQGSARSSSSSTQRSALAGLLETMGMGPGGRGGSSRGSRTSDRSEELRALRDGTGQAQAQGKWSSLLLTNERVILASPITTKSSGFWHGNAKRRQMLLTDFPRVMLVKDDPVPSASGTGTGSETATSAAGQSLPEGPRVKMEFVIVPRPSVSSAAAGQVGGANRIVDVGAKGKTGLSLQTTAGSHLYTTETAEMRDRWVQALRRVLAGE